MGKVNIPLAEISDILSVRQRPLRRWFNLEKTASSVSKSARSVIKKQPEVTGQIELHIDLYYDPTKDDTASDVSEESSAATDSVFGDMGVEIVDTQSEMTETEGIATRMQTRAPTFDTDNNAETEEMADIKEGDYQIKVHVIEVRISRV